MSWSRGGGEGIALSRDDVRTRHDGAVALDRPDAADEADRSAAASTQVRYTRFSSGPAGEDGEAEYSRKRKEQ